MNMLTQLAEYSLAEIRNRYETFVDVGLRDTWQTQYFECGDKLIILADVMPASTDLSAPENRYDAETRRMQFVGKPNSHSEQVSFRKLFRGEISLEVFVRWSKENDRFMYLGNPTILNARDNLEVGPASTAIILEVSFLEDPAAQVDGGPDGTQTESLPAKAYEGRLISVLVNKYERDPSLRSACLEFYGPVCSVCNFDFLEIYGEIGRDFCHIHHIKPLGEVRKDHEVDPRKDLIPVCPNCHAMLHRHSPALHPRDLKNLIKS